MSTTIKRPPAPAFSVDVVADRIRTAVADKDYWEAEKIARRIAHTAGWRMGHSHGQGATFAFSLTHPHAGDHHVTLTDCLKPLPRPVP